MSETQGPFPHNSHAVANQSEMASASAVLMARNVSTVEPDFVATNASDSILVEDSTSLLDYVDMDQVKYLMRVILIPVFIWLGTVFNCASIVFLHRHEIRLRRSLVHLFTFLNTFDW